MWIRATPEIKKVEDLLYNYPVLKVRLANLKLDMEEAMEALSSNGQVNDIQVDPADKCIVSSCGTVDIIAQERLNHIESKIKSSERELRKIENAVDVLTDTERTLVELKYFKQLTGEQVAERIGISTATVTRLRIPLLHKILFLLGSEFTENRQDVGLENITDAVFVER